MVYGVFKLQLKINRLAWVFGVFALLISALPAVPPAAAATYRDYAAGLNAKPPAGSRFRPDLEQELAVLANAYRSQEGKNPLKADATFRAAARAHAADMMINGFMGHKGSTGHDFDSRMRAFVDDITRFPGLAENAARDTQKTPADAKKARALFAQWVESRSHRKALLSRNYQFVSTGVIQNGNKIWAVQIFFSAPRAKGMFQ
jgi:uncharacterized protein YkwD